MSLIDGIDVAIMECDECKGRKFYIFRGQNGEGYKIACAKCHHDQRDLIDELKIPYLWASKEKIKEVSNES